MSKPEPTFMGFTQHELCERMETFLKAEIEKNRRLIVERQRVRSCNNCGGTITINERGREIGHHPVC